MMNTNRGFTLIEMAVVVAVIGIMSVVLGPLFNNLITSKKQIYADKHALNNQYIGQALLEYATQQSTTGRLPDPYTGSGYTKTVRNPSDSTTDGLALAGLLAKSGVALSEVNDDGTGAQNVRVYQKVSGISLSMPVYYRSGPLVTLKYDFGALYITACAKSNTTCNPNSAIGVPGSTPSALTLANYTTWSTSGTDKTPYFFSTLSLQKQMLQTTVARIDRLRDALIQYARTLQLNSAPGDKSNFYPPNPGTMGGATGNQGCRDGWYDLSTSAQLLSYVGLSSQEYGVTAWGGPIHYCRNYDPFSVGSETNPPYYAALRIHGSVSDGLAPDASNQAANVFFSF